MSGIQTEKGVSRAGDLPTEAGEWWQFRGNRTLTGRSALRGSLAKPAVQWRRFCGARESYLALEIGNTQSGSEQKLDLPSVDLPSVDLQADQWQTMAIDWNIEGPWYDLDGTGTRQSIPPELHH